jgi:hypothetical protein
MFGCFAQSPVEHSWKDAVDAHGGGLQRRYTGTGSPGPHRCLKHGQRGGTGFARQRRNIEKQFVSFEAASTMSD